MEKMDEFGQQKNHPSFLGCLFECVPLVWKKILFSGWLGTNHHLVKRTKRGAIWSPNLGPAFWKGFSPRNFQGNLGWWNMGVSKNRDTPKSSILIGCSIINHPFWGTTIFGNTHMIPFGSESWWASPIVSRIFQTLKVQLLTETPNGEHDKLVIFKRYGGD